MPSLRKGPEVVHYAVRCVVLKRRAGVKRYLRGPVAVVQVHIVRTAPVVQIKVNLIAVYYPVPIGVRKRRGGLKAHHTVPVSVVDRYVNLIVKVKTRVGVIATCDIKVVYDSIPVVVNTVSCSPEGYIPYPIVVIRDPVTLPILPRQIMRIPQGVLYGQIHLRIVVVRKTVPVIVHPPLTRPVPVASVHKSLLLLVLRHYPILVRIQSRVIVKCGIHREHHRNQYLLHKMLPVQINLNVQVHVTVGHQRTAQEEAVQAVAIQILSLPWVPHPVLLRGDDLTNKRSIGVSVNHPAVYPTIRKSVIVRVRINWTALIEVHKTVIIPVLKSIRYAVSIRVRIRRIGVFKL